MITLLIVASVLAWIVGMIFLHQYLVVRHDWDSYLAAGFCIFAPIAIPGTGLFFVFGGLVFYVSEYAKKVWTPKPKKANVPMYELLEEDPPLNVINGSSYREPAKVPPCDSCGRE